MACHIGDQPPHQKYVAVWDPNAVPTLAEGALAAFAEAGNLAPPEGEQKATADEELAGLVASLRRTGQLGEALAASREAAGAEVKQAIR